jgi:hypothetical protein
MPEGIVRHDEHTGYVLYLTAGELALLLDALAARPRIGHGVFTLEELGQLEALEQRLWGLVGVPRHEARNQAE